jgi:AcrR family transcriptional regulator
MHRRAETTAETRTRIVEAARTVLAETPLRRFSVDETARLAGVNRTTIYDDFGSRAGLLEAVAEDLLQRIGIGRLAAVLAGQDVVQAVGDSLDLAGHLYHAAGPVAEAIFALASLDPDAARAGQVLERGRWEGMQDLARRLFGQGQVREGLSIQETAELLWVITSFQTFGQLYRQRGLTAEESASRLKALFRAVTR